MRRAFLLACLFSIAAGATDGGAPDAAPSSAADAGTAESAASGSPSTLHIRCPKACLVYVDGLRKTPTEQKQVTLEQIPPGTHQVAAKDRLNAVIGSGLIEVAPASDVYVLVGNGKATVTNTKPFR